MRIQLQRFTLSLLIIFSLLGCKVQLISPYDEVIDIGLKEYKEEINLFIKNMSDLGGTEEGTFTYNKAKYNELETKIDLLIERAQLQSTGSCKMLPEISSKIEKLLGDNLPADLRNADKNEDGNSYGCTERLLVLIKEQLASIKQIHETTDKCRAADGSNISCIRTATSKTAMDITNQSINAAWIVETTKKNSKTKLD